MTYTVEERNGTQVLVSATGCRPATEAEAYFAQRCRELEQCMSDPLNRMVRERDTLSAEVEDLKLQVQAARCTSLSSVQVADRLIYERDVLVAERDDARAEVEQLQSKLRRIEAVAECGSVQSWLALPDDAKAQWFAMHLEMDDERLAPRKDAERLQWLADNMRLMSGHKESGHYQLPELIEWVESGREGCTLDDLRRALDSKPEAV